MSATRKRMVEMEGGRGGGSPEIHAPDVTAGGLEYNRE